MLERVLSMPDFGTGKVFDEDDLENAWVCAKII
jgi:hypothetical protein